MHVVHFMCADRDSHLELLDDGMRSDAVAILVQSDLFCQLTNGRGELERHHAPKLLQQLRFYQLAKMATMSENMIFHPDEQQLELTTGGHPGIVQAANDLTLTYVFQHACKERP